MAGSSREELLADFTRSGRRGYAEAKALLKAWGFEERRSRKGHVVWVHHRGVTLTITEERELAAFYRSLIVKKIRQLRLLD